MNSWGRPLTSLPTGRRQSGTKGRDNRMFLQQMRTVYFNGSTLHKEQTFLVLIMVASCRSTWIKMIFNVLSSLCFATRQFCRTDRDSTFFLPLNAYKSKGTILFEELFCFEENWIKRRISCLSSSSQCFLTPTQSQITLWPAAEWLSGVSCRGVIGLLCHTRTTLSGIAEVTHVTHEKSFPPF